MDDSILEDQESFTIELRTPSGTVQEGLLANSSATVAITDNESEWMSAATNLWYNCSSPFRWVCQF